MEIREGHVNDASVIVEMMRGGVNEGAFHSRKITIEGFRKFAFDQRDISYKIFVSLLEDGIAGYIDSCMSMGLGQVLGLYVKPNHRRQGIGKALADRTLDVFKKEGCHKARLEVFADNKPAIKFYLNQGFIQEGCLKEDKEKRDTLIMSRFL